MRRRTDRPIDRPIETTATDQDARAKVADERQEEAKVRHRRGDEQRAERDADAQQIALRQHAQPRGAVDELVLEDLKDRKELHWKREQQRDANRNFQADGEPAREIERERAR